MDREFSTKPLTETDLVIGEGIISESEFWTERAGLALIFVRILRK